VDARLEAFRHIQKTCMAILKAVEIYQNRIFGKVCRWFLFGHTQSAFIFSSSVMSLTFSLYVYSSFISSHHRYSFLDLSLLWRTYCDLAFLVFSLISLSWIICSFKNYKEKWVSGRWTLAPCSKSIGCPAPSWHCAHWNTSAVKSGVYVVPMMLCMPTKATVTTGPFWISMWKSSRVLGYCLPKTK